MKFHLWYSARAARLDSRTSRNTASVAGSLAISRNLPSSRLPKPWRRAAAATTIFSISHSAPTARAMKKPSIRLFCSITSANRLGSDDEKISSYCCLDQCAALGDAFSSSIIGEISASVAARTVAFIDLSARFRCRQHANIRQIAILLGIIKPIADHELVWDGESQIIRFDGQLAPGRFVEQGGDAESLGLVRHQHTFEVGDCQAGIENVLHQQNISSRHLLIDI